MPKKPSRTHDVFLSYSSKDKTKADMACAVLERNRIRCWIAPRDIIHGEEWAESIIKGLDSSRIMVLIFSGHANASDQVRREVDGAISRQMTILPVRVEDIRPKGAMEFALNNRHWLDAFAPPLEEQFELLAQSVKRQLGVDVETPPGYRTTVIDPSPPRDRKKLLIALTGSLLALTALAAIFIAIKGQGGIKTKANVANDAAIDVESQFRNIESKSATIGRKKTDASDLTPSASRATGTPSVDKPDLAPTYESHASGFVPIFNGKDLTGWKTHEKQKGNWHVANGVLVGSGPELSHLYTDRGNFTDFHLHMVARFNRVGSGAVYVRCTFGPSLPTSENPKWPEGFKATINSARIAPNITGGIYPGVGDVLFVDVPDNVPREKWNCSVPFMQWFTMEVIADGNVLAVRINGHTTAVKVGGTRFQQAGHIALQQYSPETTIEFRSIEIKELNRPDQMDSRQLRRFAGSADPVSLVAFTPNGLGILSGGNAMEVMKRRDEPRLLHFAHGYELKMWSAASGKKLSTMNGAGWIAGAIAFSSDGRYAASSEISLLQQPVIIWNMKTGQRVQQLALRDREKDQACSALSFTADDKGIMAASTVGTVHVWDLASKQEQPPIALETGLIHDDQFRGAVFTSDRRQILTGSRTGLVELWDLSTRKKSQTFVGHVGGVAKVACSADGRLVLSAGSDKTIRLWDVASGKELKQLVAGEQRVRCIAISPDGRRALSAGFDGPVHLWDLTSGKELCRMEGHTMCVNSAAFSPDGHLAVSGGEDTTVRLWQLPE
jgi:WD40 repeat protein